MGNSNWDARHFAMRYGATDLMRCTEQTAVLMAGAEGTAISKESVAEIGTLSMAGWIAGSPYQPKINVYDALYESGSDGKPLHKPRLLWDAIVRMEKEKLGVDAGMLSIPLEFCFTPVDGKQALINGQTGGTVSCLCFAAPEDENSPAFKPAVQPDRPKKRGRPHSAAISPNYLVLCLSRDLIQASAGVDFFSDYVASIAAECDGGDVEDMIRRLFDGHGGKPGLPPTNGLAVLDEPGWLGNEHWRRVEVPARKKRVFHGSSIALSLATLYRNGYDCSIAVSRHQHLIAASIATRVLGGALFAVPLTPKDGGGLLVKGARVLGSRDFVTTDTAAMVVSGISEHIPLGSVARREDGVTVHSIYLSAHTGSIRRLKHRISLDTDRSSIFCSYDSEVCDLLDQKKPLVKPKHLPAKQWIERYDEMFARARQRVRTPAKGSPKSSEPG